MNKEHSSNSSASRKVKRFEIYSADLTPVMGSEQGGVRPVLIIQNDVGNYYGPTTIIAVITSKRMKKNIPTHVDLSSEKCLRQDSILLLEQLRTIDKKRLGQKLGEIYSEEVRKQIDEAIQISLGLK